MVHSVVIFASVKGFAVIEQKLTVNVLNAQNLGWGWTSLKVQEEGDVRAESERQRFYNRENHEEKALSNSKIIQVNLNEIYMVGGTDEERTLLARPYN